MDQSVPPNQVRPGALGADGGNITTLEGTSLSAVDNTRHIKTQQKLVKIIGDQNAVSIL